MLSRSQAQRVCQAALDHASLGDVRVRVRSSRVANVRFGDSMPTQNGDIEELEVAVTAATADGRHATVRGTGSTEASLTDLVKQAESLAALTPVDPEHMRPLGKTTYPPSLAYDRRVAALRPASAFAHVASAIESANAGGTQASGFLEHREVAEAVADQAGLFGYEKQTQVSLSTTTRTVDGSGSARRGFVSHALAGLDGGALAKDAATWAQRSQSPVGVDPGRYTVVLAPQAVADLMAFVVFALDHRAAVEGRSVFSASGGQTKLGQTLFLPTIQLWSDPSDRLHPASVISGDGQPQSRTVWVADGTLGAMTASRFWAVKAAVEPRPSPSSLHMGGGEGDLESLVGNVERGILVSRFWYNRMLEPRSLLVTGLTRDGTFMIENGKIAKAVKNLRYNDSPLTILTRAVAMGAPVRAGLTRGRVIVVPPVVVEGFNFESVSDAV